MQITKCLKKLIFLDYFKVTQLQNIDILEDGDFVILSQIGVEDCYWTPNDVLLPGDICQVTHTYDDKIRACNVKNDLCYFLPIDSVIKILNEDVIRKISVQSERLRAQRFLSQEMESQMTRENYRTRSFGRDAEGAVYGNYLPGNWSSWSIPGGPSTT